MEKYGIKPFQEFVESTDLPLLADQKAELVRLIEHNTVLLEVVSRSSNGKKEDQAAVEKLSGQIALQTGLLHFLDFFQDMLVDDYKMNPKHVYKFEGDED